MAVGLLAYCKECCAIENMDSSVISFEEVKRMKCTKCKSELWLPNELIHFFALFGIFVPQALAVSILFGATKVETSLLPQYVASTANIIFQSAEIGKPYDVAVPRSNGGLGLKIMKQGEHVVVGGFTTISNGEAGPAELTRRISTGDILVAVNKESVKSLNFHQQVKMLSTSPSPLYLSFVRPAEDVLYLK